MSATLERLRRLQRLRPRQTENITEPELPPALGKGRPSGALEELVPGREVENDAGCCYLVETRIPLESLRGPYRLGDLLGRSALSLAEIYPGASSARNCDFGHAVFVDTETTGLGGGAGVYAFMVGVGAFEMDKAGVPLDFVVRQYFMRHPGEELSLLLEIERFAESRAGIVSFNGRTFDLPLLRNRFRLNRAPLPDLLAENTPHLDLLHPARRIWRRRLPSCALSALEKSIIGHQRSDSDVEGHLIPYLYADFLQNGDAGQIQRVFYHNLEDIVSMVVLADQLCLCFDRPLDLAEQGKMEGLDLFSLGRLYEERDRLDEAERCYEYALNMQAVGDGIGEIFSSLGRLYKRQERWAEAVELWQRWLSSVAEFDPRPCEELAKYWEWRGRDLAEAEIWAAWALHALQKAPPGQAMRRMIASFEHRLARIRGKRSGPDDSATTLPTQA